MRYYDYKTYSLRMLIVDEENDREMKLRASLLKVYVTDIPALLDQK